MIVFFFCFDLSNWRRGGVLGDLFNFIINCFKVFYFFFCYFFCFFRVVGYDYDFFGEGDRKSVV